MQQQAQQQEAPVMMQQGPMPVQQIAQPVVQPVIQPVVVQPAAQPTVETQFVAPVQPEQAQTPPPPTA